jgi:hypothetical protein
MPTTVAVSGMTTGSAVPSAQHPARSHARAVVATLVATLALAVLLLVAFEPDVQTVGADELVARRGEARAFLIGDYVFVVVYGLLSPIAIWRFGRALGSGAPPRWFVLTALLLGAAGIVDAAENTLLLAATGSPSKATVDAAHALEVPKVALFAAGALLALGVNARALAVLRRSG